MNIKEIVLITSAFPYEPGEQFLETEVNYWGQQENINFTILPCSKSEVIREVPSNIKVNDILCINNFTLFQKVKYFMKVFDSMLLYRELKYILSKPIVLPIAIKSIAKVLFYKELLESYIKKNDKELIFYTYWHNESTYALQLLNNKYNIKVVTRTHGHDLYEERRKFHYMPLRRQLLGHLDKIFTITNNAESYIVNQYGFNSSIIETSKLGVNEYGIVARKSEEKHFSIVSCSFLVEVKRVDKLLLALQKLAKLHKTVSIQWTHIGDGPLRKTLENLARSENNSENLKINFIGHLNNKDVYGFYKANPVDVFINVSESEGAPVSIMEAMSCGIPIVAPNVGGISDMVIDKFNGILLSSNATANDIADALLNIDFFKKETIRKNSYMIYKEKYDAKKNYSEFISKLMKL